ncbi:MAG: MBL fold metallo-hydrolase, partial [Acidobacteriota bacterium]|nr:MBL fold metallo-hydrolase [Acidobacteriota bacterium]
MALMEIATGVARLPVSIANVYFVGEPGSWTLVDAGTPDRAKQIKAAAESRFGPGAKPTAIILTHGHFDHAGSARDLAGMWNVPVYAHPLEFPFLKGRSAYPPKDPT